MSRTIRAGRLLDRLRRRRDEKGAYAILFSMMLVLVIALAAIAVDIASQVASKQALKDAMDSAAHAGAYELPDNAAGATTAAVNMARANDPRSNPVSDLWCVVASTGTTKQVNVTQIPSTCNPGPGAYTKVKYPGLACDEVLCFIPCKASSTTRCNTIRVADKKVVPYAFAPAIGQKQGSTGAVVSVACKGSCGTEVPNPLDIVVVADRTASMVTNDRQMMKSAILESFKLMNPEMHYVALGTLHKSRLTNFTSKTNTYGPQSDDYYVERCPSGCSASQEAYYDTTSKLNYNGHWDGTGKTGSGTTCLSEAQTNAPASKAVPPYTKWNTTVKIGSTNYTIPARPNPSTSIARVKEGTWIPVGFKNDYQRPKATPTDPTVLNTSSTLVDSVSCLPQSMLGEFGTNLASAMKASVKYAFDNDPAPTRSGKIRKVVIFETDGQPSEPETFGNTDLDSGDLGNSSGKIGCQNFASVAEKAKERHGEELVVITIGFGAAVDEKCSTAKGDSYLRDVLAAAASDKPSGGASDASNCGTSTGQKAENTDGDFFFCSSDGSDLANIFATAMTSVGGSIKLLKMPKG